MGARTGDEPMTRWRVRNNELEALLTGVASGAGAPHALRDALLRAAVGHAVLAPSGHNTQPWRFRLGDDAVELYADRRRALPVVDPEDRELTVSCGAALYQLRLAIRHAGFGETTTLLPDPADADLLASVRLADPRAAAPDEEVLFAAIPRRHTNRAPFDGRAIPDAQLLALRHAAQAEGAGLVLLSERAERERVADLVAAGDRLQAADLAFRRELAAWLHPNWSHRRDGMPGSAHGVGDATSLVFPRVVRSVDWGARVAAKDRRLAADASALAVLWTAGDTARDWLRAGQALARVLLRACADGISAGFLNQPVEVEELRAVLADTLFIPGAPQLVLRLGYGVEPTGTPRRAVVEVLDEAPPGGAG